MLHQRLKYFLNIGKAKRTENDLIIHVGKLLGVPIHIMFLFLVWLTLS